jgi:CHASE3 domain sensor protein
MNTFPTLINESLNHDAERINANREAYNRISDIVAQARGKHYTTLIRDIVDVLEQAEAEMRRNTVHNSMGGIYNP